VLVLERKEMERINIGDNVVITLVRICGNKCKIGVDAPDDMVVDREEVSQRRKERPWPKAGKCQTAS
jgi:carbon storage regulator